MVQDATLAAKPDDPSDFWDYLARQGGNWMWEGFIENNRHRDLTCLVEGLQRGTIVWCADVFCRRRKGPDISGSGAGQMCCSTESAKDRKQRLLRHER